MRLVTFRADRAERIGVLRGGDVVEVAGPADMMALIAAGDGGLGAARAAARSRDARTHALDSVELLAPLPRPSGNVIAIGRNYQAHAEESARAAGRPVDPPTVFTKAATSINGPYADIAVDASVTTQVDWEVELGVVVGATGANISRDRALDHVFGYVVVNDVSARDVQFGWGGQFFKGKSLDGFCPFGPWIVTRDEVPDPQSLRLLMRVNGQIKQDSNTRDMIYPVDTILEWVSKGMTLPAGTLIATGTPDGVGFARTPPEFVHDGDVMEAEVEGIGTLRNRVIST